MSNTSARNRDIIRDTLEYLSAEQRPIKLTLRPPAWTNIIEPEDNIMEINDGEDGVFEGIPESFYDEMVKLYHNQNQ